MTLHSPGAVSGESAPVKVLTGARNGLSQNAPVACKAHQRDILEPPVPLHIERADYTGVVEIGQRCSLELTSAYTHLDSGFGSHSDLH
jgi:hypothetical protein